LEINDENEKLTLKENNKLEMEHLIKYIEELIGTKDKGNKNIQNRFILAKAKLNFDSLKKRIRTPPQKN
jgi:hypothetical protein